MTAFLKGNTHCAVPCNCFTDPCTAAGVPVISSSHAVGGTTCTGFSYYVTATNTPTSYACTPLPAGCSFNTSTGRITGTPYTAGTTTATMTATNACGTSAGVTLTITLTAATCVSPSLVCDSIGASKHKRMYAWPHIYSGNCDWPGVYEDGELYYRTSTLSGSLTNTTYGARTGPAYDPCSGPVVGTNTVYATGSCNYPTLNDTCEINAWMASNFPEGVDTSGGCWSNGASYTGSGGCWTSDADRVTTGTVTQTLSNDFTEADLIAATVAALPSYPGTWAGTCGATRDLSSDGFSYTVSRFKYKFMLPTLTGFTHYTINWLEAGAAKSYTWNGTDTQTPVYGSVNEPGTNGSFGITSITVTCDCAP